MKPRKETGGAEQWLKESKVNMKDMGGRGEDREWTNQNYFDARNVRSVVSESPLTTIKKGRVLRVDKKI